MFSTWDPLELSAKATASAIARVDVVWNRLRPPKAARGCVCDRRADALRTTIPRVLAVRTMCRAGSQNSDLSACLVQETTLDRYFLVDRSVAPLHRAVILADRLGAKPAQPIASDQTSTNPGMGTSLVNIARTRGNGEGVIRVCSGFVCKACMKTSLQTLR